MRGSRARRLRPPRDAAPGLVRALLAACDALRPLYRALGVDYPVFRALLETKLLLDTRRGTRGDGSTRLFQNAGFAVMLAAYLMFGALLGLAVGWIEDPFWSMTLVQTAAVFLLALPLLMDFSSVLLDTADLGVVAPRPVSDRTFLAVRLTHIVLYVGLILAALELGPLVGGLVLYPPWVYAPVFLLSALLVGALTLAVVVAFYLVALRTVPVERFRDGLVYLQAGAFVAFYLATQLGPHVLRRTGLGEWLAARQGLVALVPTAGYGSLMRLALGEGRPVDRWLAPLAIVLPLLAVGALALLARRGFVGALAALEHSGGSTPRRRRRYGLTGRLCERLLRGSLERAGAGFFLAMSGAERGFRLRTIPQQAMIAAPLVMLFVLRSDEQLGGVPGLAQVVPYLPYALLLVVLGVWENLRFSDSHEAAWCLRSLGAEEQRRFVRGAMVAVLLRFLVLPALLVALAGLALAGPAVLPGMALSTSVAFLGAARGLPRLARFLPFSERYSFGRAQSNFGLNMIAAFVVLALGGAHFLVSRLPAGTWCAAAVCVPAALLAARRLPRARLALR